MKESKVKGFWSNNQYGRYWNNGFKRKWNSKSAIIKYKINKEQLLLLYKEQKFNSREISEIIGCSQSLVLYKLRQYDITKPLKESQISFWEGKKRDFKTKCLISRNRIGKSIGKERYNWRGGHKDYRGSNWSKMRKLALIRDIYTCQSCWRDRMQIKLNVHHIVAFRKFDDYKEANNLNNLITLCCVCHTKADSEYRVSEAVMSNVLNN